MKFKKILTALLLLMTITLCSCDFSSLNEPTNNETGDVLTPDETDNNSKTEESNNTSNEENLNDSKDGTNTNETLNQEQNKEQTSSLTVPYPNYSNDKNFTNTYFEDLIIEVAEYVVTTSLNKEQIDDLFIRTLYSDEYTDELDFLGLFFALTDHNVVILEDMILDFRGYVD